MDAYSGYIYAVLWLIIAVYMFWQARKESKFLYVLSGFFLFLFGWYLTNELMPSVDLFSGTYSIIFRCIMVVMLIACIIVYIRYRKKNPSEGDSDSD